MQDAHESIHPTNISFHPKENEEIIASLSNEEEKVYSLIFCHSTASLMNFSQIEKTVYIFSNNKFRFSASEKISKFLGFMACAPEIYFSRYKVKQKLILDELSQFTAEKLEVQEYLENKPVRFNEGTLVRELERLEIGRPSTYNNFGRIIQKRNYAKLNVKGQFVPTNLGFLVNN